MKRVTPEVVAEADRKAAQVVEDAAREGRVTDPWTAYHLHKAAWAAVTGADVVVVESAPPSPQG